MFQALAAECLVNALQSDRNQDGFGFGWHIGFWRLRMAQLIERQGQ